MILAGVVIGSYNFKELLSDKRVYIASFLRLILIPAAFMLALHFLGAEEELMTLALICFATPLGLNTIVYPAAYGGETKTGASMAMISHAFSVITIPLMYYVFVILI
jgi:predicted permease